MAMFQQARVSMVQRYQWQAVLFQELERSEAVH
jgi:hypothetical protein